MGPASNTGQGAAGPLERRRRVRPRGDDEASTTSVTPVTLATALECQELTIDARIGTRTIALLINSLFLIN
jgi:hypothetical protein